jgi:ribonuclease HI
LFEEQHARLVPRGTFHTAHIDGAARGNPGPASYGVVLRAPDGSVADELRKSIGRTTNNVAEYYALIAALDYAVAHGIRALRVESDSELLVRQMRGQYKVKSQELRPLHERARKMSESLEAFAIEYIRRERNREADALANQALDETGAGGVRGAAKSQARNPGAETRRVRARYRHGALHPIQPLDLPDGAEVELTIHAPRTAE